MLYDVVCLLFNIIMPYKIFCTKDIKFKTKTINGYFEKYFSIYFQIGTSNKYVREQIL